MMKTQHHTLSTILSGLMCLAVLATAGGAQHASAQGSFPGTPVQIADVDRRDLAAGFQPGDPQSTIDEAGSPQGVSQLVGNAGFESGAWSPWQTFGAPSLDTGVKYSGARSAHLGNTNNANDQVYQAVTIPSNASQITLDFWYRMSTNETDLQADYFYIGLWDQTGQTNYALVWDDFARLGGVDWTSGGYTLSADELAAVAGKTVLFAFIVQTDGSLTSRAWIDNVSLFVTAPNAPPVRKVFLPFIAKAPPGTPPVIRSFSANPAAIAPGGSSTLSWNVTGATSLSLSPGIGSVTGSSKVVNPAATTEYTLVAANAYGTTTAKTTVTVGGGGGAQGALWLPYTITGNQVLPSYGTSVAVDGSGGMHAAYAIYSGTDNGQRPASYAYCPANCTNKANWTRIKLGGYVHDVRLLLDPAGGPRLMLFGPHPVQDSYYTRMQYQYAECNSGCTNPANWTLATIVAPIEGGATREYNNNRYFAVSRHGLLAFIYTDTTQNNHPGTFYMTCAASCTNPNNWIETELTTLDNYDKPSLAFSPGGQPRLAYGTFLDDNRFYLAYAQCDNICTDPSRWSSVILHPIRGSAMFSLQVDSSGRPRMAFTSGSYATPPVEDHQAYYLWCNDACTGAANHWSLSNVGLPLVVGNVDLALDRQDRPRMAHLVAEGLGYGWCNTICETGSPAWQHRVAESNASLTDNYEVLPIHHCTVSAWINGNRPWLVLDTAGNPRIGYDAQHMWSGVYVDQPWKSCQFTDVNMTRVGLFNQP